MTSSDKKLWMEINSENYITDFGTVEGRCKMSYSAMIQEVKNIGLI